ncbi:Ribokinase [Aphelenchoides besseyi]|nr:Ribokinase [Aphelenchoides besseyi]KAI6199287.1 Ribokinase [Aphelenchoides besseyi]
MTNSILVVGGICHDFFCYVDRFPKAGETVVGHEFRMGSGGKGASASVMASKLGADVKMVGYVGDDIFADISIGMMKSAGVHTELITRTGKAMTATATIFVESTGENAIVTISGANNCFPVSRVYELKTEISHSRMVLCQYEIPHETNIAVFQLARKYNVITFLNAAPFRPDIVNNSLLKLTDIICVNQSETEALVNEQLQVLSDYEAAIPKISALGPQIVIITLGGDGALIGVRTRDKEIHVTKIDAPKVNVVDTTGAGDCFCGAFAYFYLRTDGDFIKAAEKAVQVASLSVTKLGNQSSYPMNDVLKELSIL